MTGHHTTKTTDSFGSLAQMLCADLGVDPTQTGHLGRGVHGPSTRTVRIPRPTAAEKMQANVSTDSTAVDSESKSSSAKSINPTSWYKASVEEINEHGAGYVILTRRNESALVTKSDLGRLPVAMSGEIQVRVVPKDGTPALRVTHVKINGETYDLAALPALKAEDSSAQLEPDSPPADETVPTTTLTGTLKPGGAGRKFRHIEPDNGSPGVFVPPRLVKEAKLAQQPAGSKVEYTLDPDADRPRAKTVTVPEAQQPTAQPTQDFVIGERVVGQVKNWNPEKGFGFIAVQGKRNDLFLHISAFKGQKVQKGSMVSATVTQGRDKRPAAADVRPS